MVISSILKGCIGFSTKRVSSFRPFALNPSLSTRTEVGRAFSTKVLKSSSSLSDYDIEYMKDAVACARFGLGHTFPNPAVGCVLVDDENQQILGRGFHPRSGYPHAEVFALLEAANHVPDGVAAAQSVISRYTSDSGKSESVALYETVQSLTAKYRDDDNGPEDLFEDAFSEHGHVTAYVTLEPCCHVGQTPPCALTLALAGVDRVVVGFRDPNPRVDGGGVSMLRDEFQKPVDLVADDPGASSVGKDCARLVTNFCKRITPKEAGVQDVVITGSIRRALRAMANRQKNESKLHTVSWGGPSVTQPTDANEVDEDRLMEEAVDSVELRAEWMEDLDNVLWGSELVNIRLNTAVKKRKHCSRLGARIAEALDAHVVQSVGHTVLLYRPGVPAVLNLTELKNSVEESVKKV